MRPSRNATNCDSSVSTGWPFRSMVLARGSSVTSIRSGAPSMLPSRMYECCWLTGKSGLVTLVGSEKDGSKRSTRSLSVAQPVPLSVPQVDCVRIAVAVGAGVDVGGGGPVFVGTGIAVAVGVEPALSLSLPHPEDDSTNALNTAAASSANLACMGDPLLPVQTRRSSVRMCVTRAVREISLRKVVPILARRSSGAASARRRNAGVGFHASSDRTPTTCRDRFCAVRVRSRLTSPGPSRQRSCASVSQGVPRGT